MKPVTNLLFLFAVLFCIGITSAQTQYVIEGKTYTLTTEFEGTLSLLYTSIDNEIRFFSKKGTDIKELTNTKNNGDYNEAYKEVLRDQTDGSMDDLDDIKLTLGSLRNFYNTYNKSKNSAYEYDENPIRLETRLGGFVGVSNTAYAENPTNTNHLTVGAEVEFRDANVLRRHAIAFRLKQTLSTDEHDYSETNFSFNYRFKPIVSEKFDAFIQIKVAEYLYSNYNSLVTISNPDPNGGPDIVTTQLAEDKGGNFNFAGALGIGADYKVGNGFITFTYDDIVSVTQDNNGNFPLDFTVGYKFIL